MPRASKISGSVLRQGSGGGLHAQRLHQAVHSFLNDRTQADSRAEAADFDAVQPECDRRHLRPPVHQPTEAFAQTQLMRRETFRRKAEKLPMIQDLEAPGSGIAGHGIHKPHISLAPPEGCQTENVAGQRLDANPNWRSTLDETSNNGVPDPVVSHQRVAESHDQQPRRFGLPRKRPASMSAHDAIPGFALRELNTRCTGRKHARSSRSPASTPSRRRQCLAVNNRPSCGDHARGWPNSVRLA